MALTRTILLIPNLHCPSCVARIESILQMLPARPQNTNISFIDNRLTLTHNTHVRLEDVRLLLTKAGYEIFHVTQEPVQSDATESLEDESETRETSDTKSTTGFDPLVFKAHVDRWKADRTHVDPDIRQRHQEHCQKCQIQEAARSKGELVTQTVTPLKQWETALRIRGMEGKDIERIKTTLQDFLFVEAVEMQGDSHSHTALVTFVAERQGPAENNVDSILKVMEHAINKYDFRVDIAWCSGSTTSVELPGSHDDLEDIWRATFTIEGMTCGACVAPIKHALAGLPCVRHVDVSLAQNSAVVVFNGEDNVEILAQIIEDTGKDVILQELINVGRRHENSRLDTRTISLRIDGMHCMNCPERVTNALDSLSVQISKLATQQDPITTFSYIPNAPTFTIRRIIQTISDLDSAFVVSMHYPPSLEERSQQIRQRHQRNIMYRLLLSVTAAIPTFVIGVVYMDLVSHADRGYIYLMEEVYSVSRAEWATFAMATTVYICATSYFITRTCKDVWYLWRPGSPTPIFQRFYRFGTMNMLIALGATIAYISSLTQLCISATSSAERPENAYRQSYFDSVVFLTMFLLLGRFIEASMQSKVGDAVSALGKLQPSKAYLISHPELHGNEGPQEKSLDLIDTDLIEVGDTIKVLQGASPPCDGTLLEGEQAQFDESSLTGESRAKAKSIGDAVYTGTINKGQPVSIQVTAHAGASFLDSIIQVVREGQGRGAPVERIAELLTGYFVPFITLIAILTWTIWLALGVSGTLPLDYLDVRNGGWVFWSLQFAIAVFVIACPCGLGLAAPTALYVGGGIAARHGILVKGGGSAFEEASKLDVVVLDKTGTLTESGKLRIVESDTGNPQVSSRVVHGVLRVLEQNSTHPLAKAAVAHIDALCAQDPKCVATVEATNVSELSGRGLAGIVSCDMEDMTRSQYEVLVGNEALLKERHVEIPARWTGALADWKRKGWSIIIVALRSVGPPNSSQNDRHDDWQLVGAFAAADQLRPEARQVVRNLQNCGVDVWMLTGDNEVTAQAIGEQVGIIPAHVIAGVLPAEKAAHIQLLQQNHPAAASKRSATVAMVGDGINDAPALAQADVGIAVASGADVAVQTASFVLVKSDLRAVLTLVKLSRAVFRRIVFNFAWALLYNLIALPIAAGVLYPAVSNGSHIRLDPAWAALAMALSSISVVGSSLLLRTRLPGVGFRQKNDDEEAIGSL